VESNRVVTRGCVALACGIIGLGAVLSIGLRDWTLLLGACLVVLAVCLASLAISLFYVAVLFLVALVARLGARLRRQERGEERGGHV